MKPDFMPDRLGSKSTRLGQGWRRGGFTLVELLVAIGIIVALIAILIPVVGGARKKAAQNRVQRDFETLRMGLEEYKNNNGSYPATNLNRPPAAGGPLDGPMTLMQALSGGVWDNTKKQIVPIVNGKSGRPATPLVQVDQFNLRKDLPNATSPYVVFRDQDNNPYLYYPAAVPAPDITSNANGGMFVRTNGPGSTLPLPLYNQADCPTGPSLADMRYLLGDGKKVPPYPPGSGLASDGRITPASETPSTQGPFLLWAAGPDGAYGLDPTSHTDDITNFEFPSSYRK